MELLQNPRAIRDTLHLMTTFAQKPQHKEQIDEEAKDKEAKEEEKDQDKDEEKEKEGGRRDEGSEGQTSSKKSQRDRI